MLERELFLVSGGSGGIGAAVCSQLAEMGFLPLVGYSKNHLAAENIAKCTGGVSIAIDLTSSSSILSAVQYIILTNKQLAGVILAGSPPPQICPFGQLSEQDIEQQIQVNVKGPRLLLAELVRNCFRKKKQGKIVGVLTQAMGNDIGTASSNMGAYIIAKYGMYGVLAALAADYKWLNVKTVRPGFTKTPMLNAFDERYLELQQQKTKFATAEEVAQTIINEAFS